MQDPLSADVEDEIFGQTTGSAQLVRERAVQYKGPTLSIIVPTFNEAANVNVLIHRRRSVLADEDWEVIFIDNVSSDGKSSVVRRIGSNHRHVRCLQRNNRP